MDNELDLPKLAARIRVYVNAVLAANAGASAFYSRECPATERWRDESAAALEIAEQEFVAPLEEKQ